MIRGITKDTEILSTISRKATKKDMGVIEDLIDTATEHMDRCIGLSAIQINEPVRIIVAFDGEKFVPFINPVIIDKSRFSCYEAEEGCMSLDGTRLVNRYTKIAIAHERKPNKFVREVFSGKFAQILQHEIDHLNGKLI